MRILAALLTITFALLLVGCADSDGPFEQAGEEVDEAIEETSEAVEDAAEDLEDGVDPKAL